MSLRLDGGEVGLLPVPFLTHAPLRLSSHLSLLFPPGSVVPGYDSASVLAPLTMLHGAIETAGTVDAATVNTALQLYYAPSFFGLLTTDRYGMNEQKQLALLQRDVENELNVIYPLSSATLDFIYPMPQFDERVYVHRMFAIPVELVFIGLLSACALFTLALCVYLLYHRGNQIFQAAGVQWYMFMGLGCIVAYLSILSWTVENNQTSCDIRIWAWTTAFHAFVGPMVSCALRIARIYTQGLQSVRVSNMQVAGYCLGLYLPQLVLNLFWTIFYPLRTKVIELDSLRPKYDYTICTGDDTATVIFGSVTLVYSGMMLITACFLAWRVRKAYAIFNDAKPIVRNKRMQHAALALALAARRRSCTHHRLTTVLCLIVTALSSPGSLHVHLYSRELGGGGGPVEFQLSGCFGPACSLRASECRRAHRIPVIDRHPLPTTHPRPDRDGRSGEHQRHRHRNHAEARGAYAPRAPSPCNCARSSI